MYCKNCGKEIDDKAAVCVHCGVLVSDKPITPEPETDTTLTNDEENLKSNAFGITGFVLGLLSFLISLWCIIPVLALIFSCLGYGRINQYKNKGITKAALIISIVALIVDIIWLCHTLANL